jgi:hypothetical protein
MLKKPEILQEKFDGLIMAGSDMDNSVSGVK